MKVFLGILIAILYFSINAHAQDVNLGVIKAEAQKIPIAAFDISDNVKTKGLKETVKDVLTADLKRTQLFYLVDVEKLGIDTKVNSEPQKDVIKRMGAFGVSAAVWVRLNTKDKEFVLEGNLYDSVSADIVVSKRFFGNENLIRNMFHRFVDEIVFRYTGSKGVANTRIAFISDRSGDKEMYVIDYDGSNPKKITGVRAIKLSPAWSPDGRWLAYTSYKDGNPDIYVVDLEISNRWKMVGFPGLNISPAWSPNGELLAFTLSKDGNSEIYTVKRDGSDFKRLTYDPATDVSPTWSPNGREIAFNSDRGGTPQIYIMNADGTNTRRLTFWGDYNTSPTWSPKGEKISFVSRIDGKFRICIINPDGSFFQQLTDGNTNDEGPRWSPDGRHIAFSSKRHGKSDIYIMNADGGGGERLTSDGSNNIKPSWSPGCGEAKG